MPTPESADAFAKLVAARARLTEITKLLNESHERGSVQGYERLQAEWDTAYKEFQAATDVFSAAVERLPEILAHRRPMPQNSH
jgi:hypothetical protein